MMPCDLCREAIAIGAAFEQQKLRLANLLVEIRKSHSWVDSGSESFEGFVTDQVRISMRMAQELMRLVTKCKELKISPEIIDELGWSKMAGVVTQLTAENMEEMLNDVRNMSTKQLRTKYAKAKPSKKPKSCDTNGPKRDQISLTSEILEAIAQAGRFSGSNDPQVNLVFICRHFLQEHEFSPARPRPSRN